MRQIEDAQASVSEACAAQDAYTLVIRSAVTERARHRPHEAVVHAMARVVHYPTDAADGPLSCVDELKECKFSAALSRRRLGLRRGRRGSYRQRNRHGSCLSVSAPRTKTLHLSDRSPQVSVIIPCRNERHYIGPCLDSILGNDYRRDRLELLVVDGMSDDGTAEVVESYAARISAIRMFANPLRTVPSALNLGIARARGEVILRMDAHAEYPSHYISGLVRWLLESGADNVGATWVTVPVDGSITARAIAIALSHPLGVGNARFRIGTGEARFVETVPFGCFRRELFDRVGLFDEDLVRNQDEEFNFRVIRKGGRVLLVPGIVVFYYARRSFRQLAAMYWQYGYFKPLVVRKVGAVMTVRQLVPALFVSCVLLSGIVAPWVPVARLLLGLVTAAYGGVVLAVCGTAARRNGLPVGFALAAAFVVVHFAYGLGFLRGVLDFFLFRRRPADAPTSR